MNNQTDNRIWMFSVIRYSDNYDCFLTNDFFEAHTGSSCRNIDEVTTNRRYEPAEHSPSYLQPQHVV